MYEENFYSLDEAQMGKVPGTANIHNIIKGNVLAKKISPQGGHSTLAGKLMRLGGLSPRQVLDQTKALPKVMSPDMQSKVQAGLHHIKNMARFAKSGAKSLLAREETSTPDGSASDGVALGVGLGKPHDDGNHLYRIPINNYDDSDASFVGDGEEKATSQTNIPAILAARQAGGTPDPKTVSNGINKRFKASLDPAMTDDNKGLKEAFGRPNSYLHQAINKNAEVKKNTGLGGFHKNGPFSSKLLNYFGNARSGMVDILKQHYKNGIKQNS